MPAVVGGNVRYPSLQSIADLFRASINDDFEGANDIPGEGLVATNTAPFMLTIMNAAIRDVYADLRNVGDPSLILDNYILFGLPALPNPDPAVQVSLSYAGFFDGSTVRPQWTLPISCQKVLRLWERLSSTPARPTTIPGTYQSTTAYINAAGVLSLFASSPLGNTSVTGQWSNFQIAPGNDLPDDAVIQGIIPVFQGSQKLQMAVHRYSFAPGVAPSAGVFTIPFNPQAATSSFDSTLFYAHSIGTDLSVLPDQTMTIDVDGSISAEGFLDTTTITSLGFAIYYTSATPTTNPQIPPPFDIPDGQGLQWAIPFSVDINVGNEGAGTIEATPVILTVVKNTIIETGNIPANVPFTPGYSQLEFNSMKQVPNGLPGINQQNCMGIWEMRQNAIWLPGSLMSIDLRIRCSITFPDFLDPNVIDFSTTYVPILDSQNAIEAKMRRRYASRFAPDMKAGAMQDEIEYMGKLQLEVVRQMQTQETMRSPFGDEATTDFAATFQL